MRKAEKRLDIGGGRAKGPLLNIAAHPIKGPLIDFEADNRRREEEAVAELKRKQREWVGNFSTGRVCNCGHAHITDHATVENPNASYIPMSERRFGPQPTAREQNEAFRVYHAYWCDRCGAVYKNEVIEGVRGYVPIEKQS